MELVAITLENALASSIQNLPAIAQDVMSSTRELYRATGYRPPWVGYLGVDHAECVGTCAFKTVPVNRGVEIAYFTFPGHEGRGIASRMAECLIELAKREVPGIRLHAQTLPEHNASTRVLEKLGFRMTAVVEHPEDGRVWEWAMMPKAQSAALEGESAMPAPRQPC